ncbi:MAG TPA: DUF2569 domain-containing protein [Sphingomicrobium sp.]|nr:DUF2569 domain-containing protein [Sphingomicrobium sp.]
MFSRYSDRMKARSAALLLTIDGRLHRILQAWLLLAGLAAALRIGLTTPVGPVAELSTAGSYLLLVFAPVASTLLALRWFRSGHSLPQPGTRLARVGRWRAVPRVEAERHSLYGASGIMVSLLVGMMLNVPVRGLEYLAAMPPVPQAAPAWFSTLHFAMTFDVVLFGSLYMIAFVAALRRVPLFPRLLLAIWVGDLAMQLATAELVTATGNVPAGVAEALHALLEGNVKKVLISMALWLPYLLLSTRVNVTYRHRIPA